MQYSKNFLNSHKISIVITARNYGIYLHECISSCLNQSIKPHEIIYSDDCSADDSIAIASSLGCIIVRHKTHAGVVKARNNGVKKTTGNILVHVDGDDVLPVDFLEKHLEVFDETTPFVYCAAQAFGNHNAFWRVEPWEKLFLWNRNFVNTSAMMWKDKFWEAGGWQETCKNTMWDWSLAIRLSRLGTPKMSSAVLHYRQHNDSWSLSREKKNIQELSTCIRRELVNVSIGLVYGGRVADLFPDWMEALCRDIKFLKNKPEFIIINNSGKYLSVAKWQKHFSKVKIITGELLGAYKDETDRRNKVCTLLAKCYNRILENATGELIHLREDDVIGPVGGFEKIFNFATETFPVRHAVAGLYFNRNVNWKKYVGGFYNLKNPRQTKDFDKIPSEKPFLVDFTGTGFLIFWKDICPTFEPFIDGIQAHDWAWGMELKRRGGKLWIMPEVLCKHHHDKDNYILPTPEYAAITPTAAFTKPTAETKQRAPIPIVKRPFSFKLP